MAHRKGRSVLTGAGIVLGVAILFGVLVANATTQKGIDNFLSDITGRADVITSPVGVFTADLPEGSLEHLAGLPGVADAVGRFGFGTALADYPSPNDPEQPAGLVVSGLVLEEARKVQRYELDQGRFPAPGTDELLLSSPIADELALEVGQNLEIRGAAESRSLEVVGILDRTGAGQTWEGWVTYAPMDTTRALAGAQPGTYGEVALILDEGTEVEAWIDDHREAVPGVRLQNAETLAQGFRDFAEVFGLFLTFFAGITLFVGSFLIYLTLSMAVIERTRLYGSLRALGASKHQVRRVVLTEAVALGAVSTVAGLLLGLVLALGLLTLMSSFFDVTMPRLVVSPASLVAAVAVGLVVTVGSALIPAVRAGRLSPIEAMKGDFARDTRLGRAWMAGAVILAFGLALQFATGSGSGIGPVAMILVLLGTVLLVPLLLRPLATALGRITNRIARGVGDIAVLHLSKERSRSAYTLALVMVVMAMIFASGGLYMSVRGTVEEMIDRQFGNDLFVFTRTPQAGSLLDPLRQQPGVAEVSPTWFGDMTALDGSERVEVFARTIEPESYFRLSSFFWIDGSDSAAEDALTRGGSVLVADEVARMFSLERGDSLTLETRAGTIDFEVAGITSPQFGPPEIVMGTPDARRHLSIAAPMGYLIDVVEGAQPSAVGRSLQAAFPEGTLGFETSSELREEVRGQVLNFFQIVYAILAVAGIVGLLGLANTLAMSVLQRVREIGILRAIGVTRSQTWRMVLVESSTMGLVAFVLSLPLGWVLSYLFMRGTSESFGISFDIVYPWSWIPYVAIFGLFVAVVAAIAPGRRAARLEVVTALQYE